MELLRDHHSGISARITLYFACYSGTYVTSKLTEKLTYDLSAKAITLVRSFFSSPFSQFCEKRLGNSEFLLSLKKLVCTHEAGLTSKMFFGERRKILWVSWKLQTQDNSVPDLAGGFYFLD